MKNIDTTLVNSKIEQAVAAAAAWETDREGLLGCLACTDYTTLRETASPRSVSLFTKHASELG